MLDQICKLLHPFMPFLTEELWAIRGEATCRAKACWLWRCGRISRGLRIAEAEAEVGWVVDLVSQVRSVRAEMNVPAGRANSAGAGRRRARRTSSARPRWDETLKRLARLSEIELFAKAPPHSVQVVSRGTALALPLAGVIDFAAERARLEKGIAAEQKEIGKIDAKLGNADFLRRAPEEVVEEQQERRETAVARLEKMTAALKMLS